MNTLEEALQYADKLLFDDIQRYGSVREAYGELNDASRAVIAAMKEHHGRCWIGLINEHTYGEPTPWIWEWDGGLVYNFGCAFVLPCHDTELEQMLQERHTAGYEGMGRDWKRVETINERIMALGGHHLFWS